MEDPNLRIGVFLPPISESDGTGAYPANPIRKTPWGEFVPTDAMGLPSMHSWRAYPSPNVNLMSDGL